MSKRNKDNKHFIKVNKWIYNNSNRINAICKMLKLKLPEVPEINKSYKREKKVLFIVIGFLP